jgi:hypothetical protein
MSDHSSAPAPPAPAATSANSGAQGAETAEEAVAIMLLEKIHNAERNEKAQLANDKKVDEFGRTVGLQQKFTLSFTMPAVEHEETQNEETQKDHQSQREVAHLANINLESGGNVTRDEKDKQVSEDFGVFVGKVMQPLADSELATEITRLRRSGSRLDGIQALTLTASFDLEVSIYIYSLSRHASLVLVTCTD